MATQQNNNENNNGVARAVHVDEGTHNGSELHPNPIGPTQVAKVESETRESEKFGTLGCAIEEGVEKISLVGGSQSSVKIEGNGEIMKGDDEDDDESESSESESANGSSSSSSRGSSSSSSDSDDDDDDEEEEEEEEEKGEGQARHDGDVEVEEGEIKGSKGRELVDDDDSEDGDNIVSWSMVDDDDVDVVDDDDEDGNKGPVKSKNELEDLPPVPPVNVTLEQHHQMLPVGVVMSIIGAQVIVEGVEKHDPLNEGSILWITESRKPLGLVDEIFGPVKNPYYIVRYNSENEVPAGIHGGTLISFVPEFADHVLNNKDLYNKGYDASGANDEELSDEAEFSDDEKEAEYKRMQRMTKRGTNDQNPGKRKNNKKKVSQKGHAVPTISDAPAAPLLDHGNFSPFSSIGQGPFGGATTLPPFPASNAGPNLAANGVWTTGASLPQQPQPGLLPNGFPTNGISWYPQNTQISLRLPVPGIPYQQQFHPTQGSLSTAMLPGVQPNIFAQPMYAQGFVGQNQMTFGLSSPFPQIQPPIGAAQQGFQSSELQSGAHSQFHPGASASRGRKTFHGAGRKGWRPRGK